MPVWKRNAPSRREVLKAAGLSGAGLLLGVKPSAARTYQANEKLAIGVVGVANRGADNLNGVAGQHIAALCDVDANYLAKAAERFPSAAAYADYRKLIEHKGLDAVVCSTPDHLHAPVTSTALQNKLHVYCEKPLTHTVYEARVVAELAARHQRVTQMGTQIHAEQNYRRVVELIQAGAIGPVREVHNWVSRGWSGPGRPADSPPVPAHLNWDLWLGPAPERPYHPAYVPFYWRGWWDFGNGGLGDMGCHHMDLSFWALKLRYPTSVEARGPAPNAENCPEWLEARYEFPQRGDLPPVTLTWHHGDKRPRYFEEGKLPKWGDGTLFVGEKGMLLADYGRRILLPEKDFADYTPPAETIPNSIGHYEEWIQACKTGGPTTCNFDYAGALTEAVLLGNIAYRTGKRLEWNPILLRADNAPEASAYVRKEYRKGWNL